MTRYIAFDVETLNFHNNRMSAIGISVIEDGEIIDEKNAEIRKNFINIID